MQDIDILIINLERAKARKKAIQEQFKGCEITFNFFTAVDGINTPQHPLFKKYNDKARQQSGSNSLSLGQLGCYASHYEAWRYCVEKNTAIIIMEDDAVINPEKLAAFINLASNDLPKQYTCIRLFPNTSKYGDTRSIPSLQTNDMTISKFQKGHMRGTAYFLTPTAAATFLKASNEWKYELDIFIDRFWEHKVECYGLIPPCIDHDHNNDSTIDYENIVKRPKDFHLKLTKELYSARDYLWRTAHNLYYRLRHLKKSFYK